MQFEVRAMPPSGHDRRYRAGRSWGKSPTIVKVVDNPTPPRIEKDRDGHEMRTYSDEISPAGLEALRRDPHFSVVPKDGPGGDALEVNALKAKILEQQLELDQERAEKAGLLEEHKAFRSGSMKDAEEKAARIVQLEQELAASRSALAPKKK